MTALESPVTVRFARGDSELRLFRWPNPGRQRVLLVHGIGMGHAVYDRFTERIAPFVEVISVDLPGFGESPEPEAPLSIPATADLLAEAFDARRGELGSGPVTAIGHSMGSQVVAELAARHPALVDRVVLVAPTVDPAERSVARQALRMLQDAVTGMEPAVVVKGTLAYAATGLRWFVKKLGPTLCHRMEHVLPRVFQPALVIRGSTDPVSPRGWTVRATGLLPDATMRQLPDRGHEALISSGDPAAECILGWIGAATPTQPRPHAPMRAVVARG